MIKDLFKLSGIYAVALLIGRALTLLFFILLARVLQPKLFGDAVLFVTLNQLFTFFADFGLNQWYMKLADHQDKNRFFNQILSSRIFMLIITLLVCSFLLFFTHSFTPFVSVVLIISLIPEAFLSIIDGYYLEKKQSLIVALKPIIRNIFILIGMVVFLKNLTFETVVSLYLISTFLNLLIVFPWKIIDLNILISGRNILFTLKKSISYALLTLTSYFYARGDHLVIKYFLNSFSLGLYGTAYRYLEALSLIPTALSQNLFPLAAKKQGVSQTSIIRIIGLMSLLGLLFASILFFMAEFLIINLVGGSYSASVLPLKIFSMVLFLFFVNAPLSSIVQSSNLLKQFLPWGIANTVFNIVLNIIYVPIYGIAAAAWVMLTTEITGLIINLYFVKKLYLN